MIQSTIIPSKVEIETDLEIEKKIFQNIEQVRKTKNVIGFYEGTEYPDRYVIFGNHRDAWVFGAIDPNSGTTIMLEGENIRYWMFK